MSIAIIGMAFRFPGALDRDQLWKVMTQDTDPIAEIPRTRWDVDALHGSQPMTPARMSSRRMGSIGDVERFDASFFGISDLEAQTLDPQQRVLLETSWAALEDAGVAPDTLSGAAVGVYVGAGTWDYNKIMNRGAPELAAGVLTGTILCMASNRVSYTLDLTGPSMTIDSASSSALVALHLATQSLSRGECDLALVGGVNLILSPETSIALSQVGLLSPDGRCRSFDEAANGYVRAEGCGVVVLRRLSEAMERKDRIEAVVRGSAVNHNGRSNGLIAPRGVAQQRVMREALRNASVQPSQIGYVEAHAVGSPLADLMEVQAIKSVLSEGRSPDDSCVIGTVDSCVGHLEQAAGMAKLIAAVLCIQRGMVPHVHHLNRVQPQVAALLRGSPFRVATENALWPRGAAGRFAAVSSFGFGGTNAHIILSEHPPRATVAFESSPAVLFTLRAKSGDALRRLARRYSELLVCAGVLPLNAISHTANTGRAALKHRLAIVATSREQLRRRLDGFLGGDAAEQWVEGTAEPKPRIVFICGDGPAGPLNWDELAAIHAFGEAMQPWMEAAGRFTKLPRGQHRLAALMDGVCGQTGKQLAVAALNAALGALWADWGIKPAAIVARGVGEFVSASITGDVSADTVLEWLEQARGQTVPLATIGGELLAKGSRVPRVSAATGTRIGLAAQEVSAALSPECPPRRFRDALALLGRADVLLELAPDPLLWPEVSRAQSGVRRYGSLRTGRSHLESLLNVAAELFVAGAPLDFERLQRGERHVRVVLPTYPFEGRSHWSPHPSARELHRRPAI